jgi:hypothetical protein
MTMLRRCASRFSVRCLGDKSRADQRGTNSACVCCNYIHCDWWLFLSVDDKLKPGKQLWGQAPSGVQVRRQGLTSSCSFCMCRPVSRMTGWSDGLQHTRKGPDSKI